MKTLNQILTESKSKGLQKHSIYFNDEDYKSFKSHPATRLYQHKRHAGANGDTTIYSNNRKQLCNDLEKAIDFGATTADEVLKTHK